MLKIIEKRILISFLFVLLSVFGYYSFQQLAVEAYPDIADVSVQVLTQIPGLAAEEMEQQITVPVERALNGLPGLAVMRSKSTFGLSIITLVFQDGVEDYWARERVQERISQVELPHGASPELDPLTSPTGEIFRYIIESPTENLMQLTELQNFVIIPRLKQVTGVADITNFGGAEIQFHVEIDPIRLEQYQIPLSQVVKTIEENNTNAGGSVLVKGDLAYVVRAIGMVQDLQDLGKIVLKTEKGLPVLLSDVADIHQGTLDKKGILSYSDANSDHKHSIEGIVLLLRGQNPSAVLDGLHLAVQELNEQILPKSVKIKTVLDRTDLVNTTLDTVSHTLLEGMLLVIVTLILFLGNLRGAILVAITIPLALLFAFILMHFTDIPANLLSLGAIDFGIIIDGAIVMLESILKMREQDPKLALQKEAVAKETKNLVKPIFFSTLIIITAYLPLFALERVEKKLFAPMAFTLAYALLGALLVALVLIPAWAFFLYKKPQVPYHNPWLGKLNKIYENQVKTAILHPKRALTLGASLIVGLFIMFVYVGKDFLPTLDEGSIWLQVQLPSGISLEKSAKFADTLRMRTLKHLEVSYILVQAGRNEDGTDPWTPSHLEVSVGLKPYKTWKNGKTKTDLIAELEKEYQNIPGMHVGFSQPMIDGVMDKIAGAHSELVIKVYGNDLTQTRQVATEIMQILQGIPGASDVAIDQEPPLPQMQIRIDRDKIARYALNVSDVEELISIAIGGKAIATAFVEGKTYDIVCRYRNSSRETFEQIGNLMLTNDLGIKIPLAQVSSIHLSTGESTITREMNKRHLTVKLNVRNRDLSSLLSEAQAKIAHLASENIHIKWGGQFENQNRAYARLALLVPLVLALMFMLLYSAFGSWWQALLIMGVVPMAAFGGLLALQLRGMTLNVSSAIGFIALFGVAIQNGVILLSQINILKNRGLTTLNAIEQGAAQRFRPILMTACLAVLGLLPASLATGIGSDVQRPLATVIVYGLLFSTILTLYVLPSLYAFLSQKFEREKNVENL
jgi:cobalt-zinc-cadmium resistance protein CzcA